MPSRSLCRQNTRRPASRVVAFSATPRRLACRVVARRQSVLGFACARLRQGYGAAVSAGHHGGERRLEARGVEPLSSKPSLQTSTCLAGDLFLGSRRLRRHTPSPEPPRGFLHRPARSLRRPISLLSMFGAVAGVQLRTSRSIKPRERDLGDLHLFFLVRILRRPTNHPPHAACASDYESKPVRPRFFERPES